MTLTLWVNCCFVTIAFANSIISKHFHF